MNMAYSAELEDAMMIRNVVCAIALPLVAGSALANDRAIDAVIADMKAKADRCAGELSAVGLLAENCVSACGGGATMVQTRFADRGREYEGNVKNVIDARAVNPCNMTFANAEAASSFPTIPDIEGVLMGAANGRAGFSVRVIGRDDWSQICGNSAYLKNHGEMMETLRASKLDQFYVRFEGITYDPDQIGDTVRSPCTAERGIILSSN